jgi:membrane protease YdiL (CAAX protease family)
VSTPDRVRLARRGLAIYFGVLIAGSAVLEGMLISAEGPIERHLSLVYLLMWTPAFASLVARTLLREGLWDVSFRWGGREGTRAVLLGWLFPVGVGLLAYGAAWLAGLAVFQSPSIPDFAVLLIKMLILGTLLSALSAAGEEIGWRGYMLTRLIDSGVKKPVLVSGIVWGLWHVPLILGGKYASGPLPLVSAGIFLLDVVAAGYLAAWLRLRSGSVWPAIVFHASWNVIIQGVFDRSTQGISIWVGESGILVALINVILVARIVRGSWIVKRCPTDGEVAPLRLATA